MSVQCAVTGILSYQLLMVALLSRLNAEVLPAFFTAYKEDPDRPSSGVAKVVGKLTVNLFAARGLTRGDIQAYGVFECEGTEYATEAASTLIGEPR